MRHRFLITLILIVLTYISFTVIASVSTIMATAREPELQQVRIRPPDCGHLYNVDRHREWADCMGVGYK